MLNFLIPKNRLRAFDVFEENIENFKVFGISQINPYCPEKYENEIFVTVVTVANDSKDYDEKEGLVLAKYFTIRRCPRCKRIELVPIKIKINQDSTYIKHEEEIAYDAFEEFPSRRHFPTTVEAYCNSCSSCFEIRIKSKDVWIKEAKKITNKQIASELGGLPPEKMHCSVMGREALEDALKNYQKDEDWSELEDDEKQDGQKIICHCFSVTEQQIVDAIVKNGAKTMEDISKITSCIFSVSFSIAI